MRILGLVDLHWRGGGPSPLAGLTGWDLLVLGGDFTHFGTVERARRLLDPVREAGIAVRAVCGNCDPPALEGWLAEEGLALDGRVEELGGLRLMGLSGSLPFDGCPYERTEEEYGRLTASLAERMRALPPAPTLLVTHQPPLQTACDRIRSGAHVGSQALRAFIEGRQPDLVLCGHIHESAGAGRIGASRIVNPGPAGAGGRLELELREGRLRILPSSTQGGEGA